jgi:hypothetical protein
MPRYERKRILIWGKTRPELSRTYKETVCTGGVLADTRRLIRLYPVWLRYLSDDAMFAKYQWVEADIAKNEQDTRPESFRIRPDSIVLGEKVPTDDSWRLRAEWVMAPHNLHQSVEALQAAQKRDRTSLGIVRPKEFVDFTAEPFSDEEKADFLKKYRQITTQPDLFGELEPEPVRPLSHPDYRFRIHFRCDGPACTKPHEFSVIDWEADALYWGCRGRGDTPEQARDKVVAKLRDDVCSAAKDTHLFLGNMKAHPHVFTVVGLWYPKKGKNRQPSLFE